MEFEKMKMETVNLTDAAIEKLADLFPSCVAETVDENGNKKQSVKS